MAHLSNPGWTPPEHPLDRVTAADSHPPPAADPATITTDQLSAALEGWGIDLEDVQTIGLSANARGGALTLTRLRRDAERRLIQAGGDVATVTVVIGIVRPKPPVEVR